MTDNKPLLALPPDREALLSMVGVHKENIYQMVRQILDDMEAAAPWEGLYYPPNDSQAFLDMENAFLDVIEKIPPRLKKLTESFLLEGMDPEAEQVLGDAEFFFGAIHDNVAGEIKKLSNKLRALAVTSGSIALTPAERAFACEITADLKGKYASSIMGAAATLIASGLWNGVEIEPILFPEKLEEFQRNELLVQILQEVVGNINNLLEELPLAELVQQWEKGQRVDQYALTTLYSFLGNLGKLMKGKCRRALYSGDYHQIQKRETLLSSRINELTTLHHVTWGTVPKEVIGGADVPIYPLMIQKATELAAILDLDIMRKIVGGDTVKDMLSIVTVEKEQQKAESRDNPYLTIEPKASPLRQKLPEHLRSLVPLLYDEDLQKFLMLLLGSVQKRASLEVTRQRAQAGEKPLVPAIDPTLEDEPSFPSLDDPDFFDAEPAPADSTPIFAAKQQDPITEPVPTLARHTGSFTVPEQVFASSESSVQIEFATHEPVPPETPEVEMEVEFDTIVTMPDAAPTPPVTEPAQIPQAEALVTAETPTAAETLGTSVSFDTPDSFANAESFAPASFGTAPSFAPATFDEVSFGEPEEPAQTAATNPFQADNADDALDAALPSFGESTEVQAPPDFEPRLDVGQPVVPQPSDTYEMPKVSAPSARDRPPTFTEPSATYDRPSFGPKDSPFERKISMDEVLTPLPEFDFPDLPEPNLPATEESVGPVDPEAMARLDSLRDLADILENLLSRQNSHRKSFEMVHRLLQRRKTVPPSMLEAMHPYLYDVLNMLVPQLHNLPATPEIPQERATELIETCTFLCNKKMNPLQVKNDVLPTLERFLGMLETLSRDTKKLADRLSSDSMAS